MFWYHNVRATQQIKATYDQLRRPTIETADAFTRSLPVPKKRVNLRDTITGQATYPIPYRVLNITCPLVVRGTSRLIWISHDEGTSIISCCANPRINTALRLYPGNLIPTRCCPQETPSPLWLLSACLTETMHFTDAESESTTQHSSTDPALR